MYFYVYAHIFSDFSKVIILLKKKKKKKIMEKSVY